MAYGVSCNYGNLGDALQLFAPGSFQVDLKSLAPAEEVMDFSAPAVGEERCTDTSPIPPSYKQHIATTNTTGSHFSASTSTARKAHDKDSSSGLRAKQNATLASMSRSNFGMTLFTPVSANSTTAAMINDSMQLNLSALDMHFGSADVSRSAAPLYHFSEAHYEIMARFRSRTALTIGIKSTAPSYRDIVCQLATTVCSLYALEAKHPRFMVI